MYLSVSDSSVLESPSRLDEEHRLIARYAARLAAEAGNSTVSVSHLMIRQVIVQSFFVAHPYKSDLMSLVDMSQKVINVLFFSTFNE